MIRGCVLGVGWSGGNVVDRRNVAGVLDGPKVNISNLIKMRLFFIFLFFSRSETNESTRRNIISQHEKNGDVLLRCFQCNEEVSPLISTKYTHTDQDAAVSIRNFVR